jgi:hypothetical protein
VEVGLVGKEGFIGIPLVAGFRTAATRAVAQIDATAFRVDSQTLTGILRQCRQLERRLQQFSQVMAMEVTQIAACNRLHEVDERLARWLLMSTDRIGSSSLALTQEVLAQMLGTRRSSVTVAAGILQRAGLIAYTRGDVEIIDRKKFEGASCECYRIMQVSAHEFEFLGVRSLYTVFDGGIDLFLEVFMPCAEHQKLLNDERDAEAALKNLRDRTPSDLLAARAEDLSRLGGYVANASFKVRTHVAVCPECSKEDDSTSAKFVSPLQISILR